MKINIVWLRRDLRLEDNTALNSALATGLPVLPVFIFDSNITDELPHDDARISFIHETLARINTRLNEYGSSVYIMKGDPLQKLEKITNTFDIHAVYINKDYEPYAIKRDNEAEKQLDRKGIKLFRFKDQVIYEESEIVKDDKNPYTVYTPYKKRWLERYIEKNSVNPPVKTAGYNNFHSCSYPLPSPGQIGFTRSYIRVRSYDLSVIPGYHKYRDFPAADSTSYVSPHLRFGTVSIRKLVKTALEQNMSFLNELIWREFFMQILFHFPDVVTGNFRKIYDHIIWRNNEKEFEKWCSGETGYPMVDAGMRQLNSTGYMHNRVRMITAGFLCKHLLIDWRWGEAYFAQKLLDYELSSNNGNWQWAAGTGCDAAPYFRVFNPETQQRKFDPRKEYMRKWVGDTEKSSYPAKIIDHEFARKRAISVYRSGMKTSSNKS